MIPELKNRRASSSSPRVGAFGRARALATLAAIIAVSLLALLGCPAKDAGETGSAAGASSGAAANKKTAAAGKKAAPTEIQASGREAVQILETAFALLDEERWKDAQTELMKLKDMTEKFDSADKAKRDRMLKAAISADEAIRDTKRHEALKGANEALFAASEIAFIGDPSMPNDLFRLEFYARELKVWAAAKDQAKIKAAALNIKESWQQVKIELGKHGDEGRDLINKFEPLVMALDLADTPEKSGGIARPILDQTGAMKRLFGRA